MEDQGSDGSGREDLLLKMLQEMQQKMDEQAQAQAQGQAQAQAQAQAQTQALVQRLDEQARKLDEWRGELSAIKKETACYVREQCEELTETVSRRLCEVESDSEARVQAAVNHVANLRQEVAELRVTVERRASRTALVVDSDVGVSGGFQGVVTETGDARQYSASNPLQCAAPPAVTTPPRTPTPPDSPRSGRSACSSRGGGRNQRRKPAEFSGDVAWEAYQRQFECVARGQGWSDADKAYQLIASLRGPASQILAQLTPAQCSSYQKVAEALQQRFGVSLQAEVYRTQLKERVRRQGEPLPRLAQDLEALVRNAYPEAPEKMVALLARDHFIDALGDRQLQIYVKQAHVTTVQDALTKALEFEAFLRSSGAPVVPAPYEHRAPARHFRARRTQARPTTPPSRGEARQFGGKCWKCGQKGHRRVECRSERRTRSLEELPTRFSPRSPPCCMNCGQQGHTRANCQELRDVMQVGNGAGLGARPVAQPPSPTGASSN